MISVTGFIDVLKNNHLWIEDQAIEASHSITGKPVTDSRLIEKGDAFICIKGFASDGHDFISQACGKGVAVIIQEIPFEHSLTAIRVTNSRKAAALLAKYYFDNPTGKFTLIGITGTNGKTTTSLLIWQALTRLGYKTGWIGTLGYRIGNDVIPTNNTTPDIMELNNIFAMMVAADCKYVVMEVSSHALALDRVFGLEFDLALYLNLSRDHLDFHKDMQDYFESKYLLFEYTMRQNGTSIINIDDEYGRLIEKRIHTLGKFKFKTISESVGHYIISKPSFTTAGCDFTLMEKGKAALKFESHLVGHFNMLNVGMAIAALKELFPEMDNALLQDTIALLNPVKGRLEQVKNDRGIGIFVDYAHTPDALKNVLETLQKLHSQRIITVFGAGGDRDKGKRSEMLQAVLKFSDAAIITDDNPRTEDPNQIIRDIVMDIDLWQPWWIIRDRKQAIEAALKLAQPGDVVLLAGKGHETYQEINGVKHPFDDVQISSELLNNSSESETDKLVLPVEALMLELLLKSEFKTLIEEAKSYQYISTDSRTIKSCSLYFALKGEVFNGMDYVDSVLADKDNAAVVYSELKLKDRTIVVKDTQAALGLLARKYLLMFGVHKIALTGSTGKTTTKEYLANIFSEQGKVCKTQANENNMIGLSKTIFRIRPEDKTAIFELGTNHFGEIKAMAEICNPDMAMITNIGPSHLEYFGDETGVYKEKTELFRRNPMTILYPGDDQRFIEFRTLGKSVGFTPVCSYQIHDVIIKEGILKFKLNKFELSAPQKASFFAINIAFAVASALEAGLNEKLIQKGLNQSIELNQRMEIRKFGKLTIINDCYNANPVSMQSAIKFWYTLEPQKQHVAILGDMLELGSHSEDYHKQIGELLAPLNFAELITVGDFSQHYHGATKQSTGTTLKRFSHYSNIDDLQINALLALYGGEMVLLIKASHGLHLERAYEAIRTQFDNPKSGNDLRE